MAIQKISVLAALILAVIAFSILAADHLVLQKDRKFAPTSVTVKVGDTVRFKNEDQVTHNIFSASPGQEFDLKIQKPGQTYVHKFVAPGKAEVRCAIHPQMKLVVTVEE
jgi:plastocyanin